VDSEALKIPKRQKLVTLWVHPEGRVIGSMYLYEQSEYHSGEEQPVEVLNNEAPFLVLQREDLDEARFYNKRSIVRVEFQAEEPADSQDLTTLRCRLHMMDGSMFEGEIREFLDPQHRRLYDYINQTGERFIKLHVDDGRTYLVNKAYIVHIAQLD